VKPNLVSFEPYPTTTHPETLAAVIEALEAKGIDIVVADGPASDAGNAAKIIKAHPLRKVCQRHGLELVNLHEHPFKEVKASNLALPVSLLALRADLLISLPVLKGHALCGMTACLKNQFGFFPASFRETLHSGKVDIHRAIAEINMLFKKAFFILDGVDVLLRNNEVRNGGVKAHLGYMLAGPDSVLLDSIAFSLLKQVDPELKNKRVAQIRHVWLAHKLGVGKLSNFNF
jgi:uncharacterized protein (DUF362 family)